MPFVLLTAVCRRFGGKDELDSAGAELYKAQVTRSQGIFSYRQVIHCWNLDDIAENIKAPTVVLHYPPKHEFRRKIKKRHYDISAFLNRIEKRFIRNLKNSWTRLLFL